MFDKYTKFMLTIIAVGIIGINIHIFKGSVIEDAYAESQRSEEDIKQMQEAVTNYLRGTKAKKAHQAGLLTRRMLSMPATMEEPAFSSLLAPTPMKPST